MSMIIFVGKTVFNGTSLLTGYAPDSCKSNVGNNKLLCLSFGNFVKIYSLLEKHFLQ